VISSSDQNLLNVKGFRKNISHKVSEQICISLSKNASLAIENGRVAFLFPRCGRDKVSCPYSEGEKSGNKMSHPDYIS